MEIRTLEATRRSYIIKKQKLEYTINKLEPLASAMDRDNSHRIHGSFQDVFKEHLKTARKELEGLDRKIGGIDSQLSEARMQQMIEDFPFPL